MSLDCCLITQSKLSHSIRIASKKVLEILKNTNESSRIISAGCKAFSKNTFKNLEEISYRLNDWFDLIFGYKQKGVPAEIAGNLFDNNSYEDVINIDNVENKGYYMRCVFFKLILG